MAQSQETSNSGAAVTAESSVAPAELPILVEFGQLWTRGLVDPSRLWELFDMSELYIYQPGYFGAPLIRSAGVLASPVFSTEERLAGFVMRSSVLAEEHRRVGTDWVLLTGAKFLELPIRARYLVIDPGSGHEVLVDLSERDETRQLAQGALPLLVGLEIDDTGKIALPPEFATFLNELSVL